MLNLLDHLIHGDPERHTGVEGVFGTEHGNFDAQIRFLQQRHEACILL